MASPSLGNPSTRRSPGRRGPGPAPRWAPRRSTALAALAGLVLAPVLAGCSGGSNDPSASGTASDSASGSASASASASASESASASAAAESSDAGDSGDSGDSGPPVPLPKLPKATDDTAGRKAFAEAVVERWGYALATNDASAVSDLGPAGKKAAPCQGCKELTTELTKRRKQGWTVAFPGATVDEVKVAPDGTDTYRAELTIDIPPSQSYFDDGTYRNDNAALKNAGFEVRMRWAKPRYELLEWRLVPPVEKSDKKKTSSKKD